MGEVYETALLDVFAQGVDTRRTDSLRQHLADELATQLNLRLETDGLCVSVVSLQELTLQETEESIRKGVEYKAKEANQQDQDKQNAERRDALLKAARTQIAWKAGAVKVHLKEQPQLSAEVSFSGVCRLQVLDEEVFFATPEISRFLSSGSDAAGYFDEKISALMLRHLTDVVQEFIYGGRIDSIMDRYAYRVIREPVMDALSSDLVHEGLGVQILNINTPDAIRASQKLEDHLSMAERREQIIRCAERELVLKTEPILVHLKDDATVYKKTVFTAKAYMRVIDRDTFFGASEVKGFLEGSSVPQAEVTAYYANRINLLFSDGLSRIVQAVVDETNADIRELSRLNGVLHDQVAGEISRRAYCLGMEMQSLDLHMPLDVEKSQNLLAWKDMQNVRSGAALGQEIERIRNNQVIFARTEENRVEISSAQSDSDKLERLADLQVRNMSRVDQVASKQDELDRNHAERSHQAQLDELRRKDELRQLVEKFTSSSAEYKFEESRKEYQRQYTLREDAIEQSIREKQLQQQAELDTASREEQARFASVLNTAENKRLLNGILHKIDESDLDWRKKLDEYSRLSRRLAVEDQAWEELTAAKAQAEKNTLLGHTQEQIRREQNETGFLADTNRIKLDTAEAEMLEKIARYGEERSKRMADSDAERQERKAVLDFEQRMRERQELLAQNMERLAQQHAHELALRDRDNQLAQQEYELKKLQFTLNYLSREATEKAGVEKARFHAEEEIKKAQAQFEAQHETEKIHAEEERARQQWQREDELAKRAEEYHKMMAKIQIFMEKLRMENERNRDNRQADVAIAQTQAQGTEQKAQTEELRRSLDHVSDQLDKHCKEMQQEMERIIGSHKALKERIKDLKPQRIPPVMYHYVQTHPYVQAQPAAYPAAPVQPAPVQSHPHAVPVQPGMGQKVCSNCGALCSIHATVCDKCTWPFA